MRVRSIRATRPCVAALATAAFCAGAVGTASAADRPFSFDVDDAPNTSALVIGPTVPSPLAIPVPGTTGIAGTIKDDGSVTVPTTGLTFNPVSLAGITATLLMTAPGTGTFDDATGAMTLDLPLRISLASAGFAVGCSIASAADPIVAHLKTTGSTTAVGPVSAVAGAPFSRTGDSGSITLVDPDADLKGASGCGAGGAAIDGIITQAAGKAALGMKGVMTLAALPKKEDPKPVQTTPPVVTTPPPVIQPSTGPSLVPQAIFAFAGKTSQKGLKKNGFVLGFTLGNPSTVTVVPTVSIPGAGKTKLKAFKKTFGAGKQSLAIAFPAALRKKALKALKKHKKVTVSSAISALATGGTTPQTFTRKITIAG